MRTVSHEAASQGAGSAFSSYFTSGMNSISRWIMLVL
jgi:hypothetical protein